jgi:hypothetical protein
LLLDKPVRPAARSERQTNRYRAGKAEQSHTHRRNLAQRANGRSIEAPLISRPKFLSLVGGAGSQIVLVGGQGEFDLAETSRGDINGSFAGTSWHDVGTIAGHINGNSITFTRKNVPVTQYWKGRLATGRIKGTLSGIDDCSWEAKMMMIRLWLLDVAYWQCAPKARITSGGRFHPESCRLIW